MMRLSCNITFVFKNNARIVQIPFCNNIDIVSSVNNFTDTAKITLPRKITADGDLLHNKIKKGDRVVIQLGYDDNLKTVFTGYVRTIDKNTPVVYNCENEAFKLKQIKLSKQVFPKLSIKEFCEKYVKGYKLDIADFSLGEVRINDDVTLASVFDYFMNNYPVKFFFRDGVFCGVLPGSMAIKSNNVATIPLVAGQNVVNDNTTYELAEDVNLQIIAKCILKNNTKLESKRPVNVADAEVRTFYCPTATDQQELDAYAEKMLLEFKVDRITGDITTFGDPFVRKLDIVKYYNPEYTEKNKKRFVVEEVTYSFGQSGYRQKIKLGGQIK